MKQCVSLICLVLILCLCGCSDKVQSEQSIEVDKLQLIGMTEVEQGSNSLFSDFIENHTKAHVFNDDNVISLSEYYDRYSKYQINAVYITEEDLNNDNQPELLIQLRWQNGEGKILVFHEHEDELYEWEPLIYGMHSPEIYKYDDGIIGVIGTSWSKSYFQYTTDGELERIFGQYSIVNDFANGDISRQYIITEYYDGTEIKECNITEIYHSEGDYELINSDIEIEEFDKLLNNFESSLGEGKLLTQT